MKFLLPVLLSFLLTIPVFAQDAAAQASPKYEEQPLQLTIKSNKEVYETGESIEIEVILENINKKGIIICTRWLPTFNLKFEVSYKDEKIESYQVRYELYSLVKEDYVKLIPSEKLIKSFNLSKYVPMDRKGIYDIKVSYKNWYKWYYATKVGTNNRTDIDAWTGELISNAISTKVIAPK